MKTGHLSLRHVMEKLGRLLDLIKCRSFTCNMVPVLKMVIGRCLLSTKGMQDSNLKFPATETKM